MKSEELNDQLNNSLVSIVNRLDSFTYRCAFDRDYTMLVMSGKVLQLTGYPMHDFINNYRLSYAEIIFGDDVPVVDDAVEKGVQQKTNWNVDYRIQMKNGDIRWVNETGGAVYNDQGHTIYLEGLVSDITSRKKAEEHREREDQTVKKIIEQVKNIIDELQQLHFVGINAQIEAAHLGDKGKGFAVVAQKIRSLASETSTSAKNISTLIKELEKLLKT